MEFLLQDREYIQLNDLLKWSKLVSTGGEANNRIVNGEVMVNGQVETRKRNKLRRGHVISFAGNEIVIV